jgi:hypothetical protein
MKKLILILTLASIININCMNDEKDTSDTLCLTPEDQTKELVYSFVFEPSKIPEGQTLQTTVAQLINAGPKEMVDTGIRVLGNVTSVPEMESQLQALRTEKIKFEADSKNTPPVEKRAEFVCQKLTELFRQEQALKQSKEFNGSN